MLVFGTFLFADTYRTGEKIRYYPVGTPKAMNKSYDSTGCYITEISKANGYPDGTYVLKLTSADLVGASVFPITFSYIVKKGDIIVLRNSSSDVTERFTDEIVRFMVDKISDNTITLSIVSE